MFLEYVTNDIFFAVEECETEREKEREKKKSMKEVEESAGLLESPPDSDDEEVKLINGFDTIVPLSLQALAHITGMIFYPI